MAGRIQLQPRQADSPAELQSASATLKDEPKNILHLIRQMNSKLCTAPSSAKQELRPTGAVRVPSTLKRTQLQTTCDSTKKSAKDSLGNYAVGKAIGAGGFGTVKRAIHRASKEVVAIKVYGLQKGRKRGIAREVQILKFVDHPNIVQYRSSFETVKHSYLVLEYIAGTTLKQYAKANKCVKESEVQAIFRQLVAAVAHLHNHGIAHRDIKLENVLVTASDQVKLIDFGFAAFDSWGTDGVCGTPKYMAPELLNHKQIPAAPADVWALGNVLFYLFTQKLPFYGYTEEELNRKILGGEYLTPHFISDEARELLEHMLDIDPVRRWCINQIQTHPWLASRY